MDIKLHKTTFRDSKAHSQAFIWRGRQTFVYLTKHLFKDASYWKSKSFYRAEFVSHVWNTEIEGKEEKQRNSN